MQLPIEKKQLREFGLLIGFGFPLIIGYLIPLVSGHNFRVWTLGICFLSVTCAIINPNLLFFPYKLWMKLGILLGWVNSRMVLGLVYIVILQPIALILTIFGYDPLRKNKRYRKRKSYRELKTSKVDLTRLF